MLSPMTTRRRINCRRAATSHAKAELAGVGNGAVPLFRMTRHDHGDRPLAKRMATSASSSRASCLSRRACDPERSPVREQLRQLQAPAR